MPEIKDDKRDPVKFAIGEKIRHLQETDPQALQEVIAGMSEQEAVDLEYDDEIMLREKQWIDLSDDSTITCLLTGRGFGKSHALAATIKRAVEKHGVRKMMIIAPTARTLTRSIAPAITGRYPPGHPNAPKLRQGWMEWPNGAELIMIPAEAGVDAPRSFSVELLFLEEAAFFGGYEEIIDQAVLTCRLPPAKTIVATTPKSTPKLIEWVKKAESGDSEIKLVNGSTLENKANLGDRFVKSIVDQYKGTRMEATELEGKLILENEDALFSLHTIAQYEVKDSEVPEMVEYSIGVDPSLLSKTTKSTVNKKHGRKSDSVGIVLTGKGTDGLIYTLEDHTKRYRTGAQWMERVCAIYDQCVAEVGAKKVSIIMEVNAVGSSFLTMGFDQIGRKEMGNKITFTFSTENKMTRASPYALMHDQGKIRWCSENNRLEGLFVELTSYTGTGKSPDAMDAWAFSMMGISPAKKHFTSTSELML